MVPLFSCTSYVAKSGHIAPATIPFSAYDIHRAMWSHAVHFHKTHVARQGCATVDPPRDTAPPRPAMTCLYDLSDGPRS